MNTWSLSICAACFLLMIWLWWKDHRGLRALASFVALGSLATWGIPLYGHWPAETKPSETTGILLTEGYDADSLRIFQTAQGSQRLPVYDVDAYIRKGLAAPHNLTVWGYGLSKAAWASLPPLHIVFHPSSLPTGISAISWPRETGAGSLLSVSGHFHRAAGDHRLFHLFLVGTGKTVLDSTTWTGGGEGAVAPHQREGGEGDFILKTIPRESGRVMYSLVLVAGDTLENNPVPFIVREPRPYNVLILASQPDFENKFLRQWLEDNGHHVAMRTGISKGKWASAFSNQAVVPLQSLPSSVLDSDQVLITDPVALSSLPEAAFSQIMKRVHRGEAGLIIRTDSLIPSTWVSSIRVIPSIDTFPLPVALLPEGDGSTVPLSTLLIRPIAHLAYQGDARPLLIDAHQQVWAGSALMGSGKVVLTTLSSAYRWMLSSDSSDYAAYWSLLLAEAAPDNGNDNSEPSGTWSAQPSLPLVRNPVSLSLLSGGTSTAERATLSGEPPLSLAGDDVPLSFAQVGGTLIPIRRDTRLPFLWQGAYWPLQTGWQASLTPEGLSWWWYAYSSDNWKTLRRFQAETDTKQYAASAEETRVAGQAEGAGTPVNAHEAGGVAATSDGPLPYLYFLLLMASLGFLWAAKKTRAPDPGFTK